MMVSDYVTPKASQVLCRSFGVVMWARHGINRNKSRTFFLYYKFALKSYDNIKPKLRIQSTNTRCLNDFLKNLFPT